MEKKLTKQQIILLVSLIFGLFFGAGNLIFPVHLGQLAGAHWLSATGGFLLSATLIPLAALIALSTTRSVGIYDLARPVGTSFAVIFLIACHMSLGPLIATPRTATVAYSLSFANWLPKAWVGNGQIIFSIIFFVLVYLASIQSKRLINLIGKYLNPIFIILLIIIFILGWLHPMGSLQQPVTSQYTHHAFSAAFLQGYNTLDAIAALTFGITIVRSIESMGYRQAGTISKIIAKTGFWAMLGTATVYIGLILMGASSLGQVSLSENGATALSQIMQFYFGSFGQAFLGVMGTLAVFTTAMGLTASFAQDFNRIFPQISYRIWLAVTTILSFLVANLGLDQIIKWAAPVLMFLYPLAIVLIILGLLNPWIKQNKLIYRTTIFFTVIPAVFDGLSNAPFANQLGGLVSYTTANGLVQTGWYQSVIPGASIGFGWLIPALLGLIVGLIGTAIMKSKNN